MDSLDLDAAFENVPRSRFLPRTAKAFAATDAPIDIGYGQTNSQPTTVRMMLEWLDPKPGDHVLDVGSGSGWTSVLLSKLVSNTGNVVATDLVPELVAFGKKNAKQFNCRNLTFHQAQKGQLGWPRHAPYDRILVSAAAEHEPEELIAQLKNGGRLVVPIKHSVWVINKLTDGGIERTEYPGFVFVPLL